MKQPPTPTQAHPIGAQRLIRVRIAQGPNPDGLYICHPLRGTLHKRAFRVAVESPYMVPAADLIAPPATQEEAS